ncbi:MAG: penicillin-binding protein [Bacteroidota bacterium]|nr:penicillin-binding protein [Bacteroidota bacterium]
MAIESKDIIIRFSLVYIGLVIFGLAVLGKAFVIQHVQSDRWEEESKNYKQRADIISASRGDICTCDGKVLATSVPYYELHMDIGAPGVRKVFKKEVEALSDSLAHFFKDLSRWQYKLMLQQAFRKEQHYLMLNKRKVSFMELQRIRKFPIFERGSIAGGLIPVQQNERVRPHGMIALRTIGALNKGAYGGIHGDIGFTGIEEMCESYLRGKDGISYKENLSGRWVPITSVEPVDGMDVISTIDANFQDFAENALLKELKKSDALYGTTILMDVKTGDVKAIANLGKEKDGSYQENYNYALGYQGCTEPGSTFKLISLMVAMEQGYIDTTNVFDTGNGVWEYRGLKVMDSDHMYGGHGVQTVKQIFEKSSNVGVAKIITKCYQGREEEFIDRIYNFGLNRKLNTGMSGEGVPTFKYPTDKAWWAGSLAAISYGYEIKLTPMHTLTFYNAVANNGKMVKPRFVRAIRQRGNIVKTFETEVIKSSICSQETLGKVRGMLEGAIEFGTGKGIKSKEYKIAGKTGTAQVANNNKGYYHEGARVYQASFAGYFPADNPQYSCIVVVVGPKGAYYGGAVAAPVFKEIADKVYTTSIEGKRGKPEVISKSVHAPLAANGRRTNLEYVCREFNIPYSSGANSHWVTALSSDTTKVSVKEKRIYIGIVPDVKGMGASDAVYLLESRGLRVSLRGIGKVKKQSLLPGVKARKGQRIDLELS